MLLTVNRSLFDSCVHECDILLTVKGLWDKPPSGWDTAVPFLDPNNKGDKGKPKKEVLMQMFEYLVKVYQVSTHEA